MMSSKSVMPQRDLETAAHAKSQPRNRRHRGHAITAAMQGTAPMWGRGANAAPPATSRMASPHVRCVCPLTTSGKYQEHRR